MNGQQRAPTRPAAGARLLTAGAEPALGLVAGLAPDRTPDPEPDPSQGTKICLNLLGRPWQLTRPASLEDLWQALTPDSFGPDERMPYWAELWPSSLVLGDWLGRVKGDISGRLCLDVGCGLGLTSLLGAFSGARVLAFDYEPDAARATRNNAMANNISGVTALTADWRAPAFRAGSFARAWAGDIMYERRFARPVAAFLDHCLAPGGVVWLAEPCRPVYHEFMALLRERNWSTRQAYETKAGFVDEHGQPLPGVPQSTVQIWELKKAGD